MADFCTVYLSSSYKDLKAHREAITKALNQLAGVKVIAMEDYVARDDVRMEAYRRLAAVMVPSDVDDVRAEWEDRYGPPPPPAEALLDAARLRAECVRLGIRSLTVASGAARLRGLDLPGSKRVRLERIAKGAKVSRDEVLIPLRVPPAETAAALVAMLRDLVPPPAPEPPSEAGAPASGTADGPR